jgi:hypothetical protein
MAIGKGVVFVMIRFERQGGIVPGRPFETSLLGGVQKHAVLRNAEAGTPGVASQGETRRGIGFQAKPNVIIPPRLLLA